MHFYVLCFLCIFVYLSTTACVCLCATLTIDPVVLWDICSNVVLIWRRTQRATKHAVLPQEIRHCSRIQVLIWGQTVKHTERHSTFSTADQNICHRYMKMTAWSPHCIYPPSPFSLSFCLSPSLCLISDSSWVSFLYTHKQFTLSRRCLQGNRPRRSLGTRVTFREM